MAAKQKTWQRSWECEVGTHLGKIVLVDENLVDDAVLLGLLRRHVVGARRVALNLVNGLPGLLREHAEDGGARL